MACTVYYNGFGSPIKRSKNSTNKKKTKKDVSIMGIGIGTVLKLIGGSPIGANVSKTVIGVKQSVVMIQDQIAGVKNFVSSALAVVQNPIGAVTSQLSGAVTSAISSVTSLPALQGISGLIPEGQALADALSSGLGPSVDALSTLGNNLAGVTLPNPSNLAEFGMADAMGAMDSLHKTFDGVIPESLGIDLNKITAPLDMVSALGDQKTFVEGITAGITGALDPVQAAVDATAVVNAHAATITTAISESQSTYASVTAALDKATQGATLKGAIESTSPVISGYAGKILTAEGQNALATT